MNERPPFALLFPGQGTEAPGMSKGWEECDVWSRTLQEAEAHCGYPLRAWMAEGPEETLKAQRHAPCAVVAHSVGLFRAHRAAGMPLPSVATGHSLGFYSAVVAAGVVPLEAALDLILAVEDACEARFQKDTQGMAFFIGLTEQELRQGLLGRSELVLSNVNGAAQFTVSGPRSSLQPLLDELRPQAVKAGLLPVRHPLHGDALVPLLPAIQRRLSHVRPQAPSFPVLSHADARFMDSPEEIWDEAIVSVARPVVWPRLVKALRERAARAYECGHGAQLANLTRWADREFIVESLEDVSLKGSWT